MNTTVQLKLKRLQALRSDESGVLSSLRDLTEFHEPWLVPHEDRRTLRGAIEQQSVAINDEFLAVFDGLSAVRVRPPPRMSARKFSQKLMPASPSPFFSGSNRSKRTSPLFQTSLAR